MKMLQFLLVTFLLASVDGSVDNQHPKCSKEWIRFLVMNACNYSKRHTAVLHLVFEESIKNSHINFIDSVNPSVSRDQPILSSLRTSRTQRIISKFSLQGNEKDVNQQHYGSLLDHPSQDWIEDETLIQEQLDDEVWQRRARSIKLLVEKCCVRICKLEDFKVLCVI
ncbi:hypothetical protein GE061_000526 [Apolygus lucorum]|uniref:Uncharacterized protein n=1 Tax=Apolygus lucorum TaxID=248454 RepID=A0A6A4KMD3_APOLU|nr:hypothetical protein GE061_000526 [Apolygus lucorum]